MATRLNYALPIARQCLLGTLRRLRPGGLAATLPRSTRERPFVIVTGAGRSGTSAVSRVLHESGIRMGSDFDPGDEDNPTGYYQERAVYETNGRMLAEMGIVSISGSTHWPWRSTVLAVAESHRDRLNTIAQSDTDGWKDPIFSATLEAWLPYLPAPPKIVVCLRSPRAYVDSVTRIYGLVGGMKAERQWARHYDRLLEVIRDYKLEAHCVEYNSLLREPERTVAALAEFVGCELQPEYVEPELKRFDRPVPAEYRALYEKVVALGGPTPSVAVPASSAASGATRLERGTDAVVIDHYVLQVSQIDETVQAAKAVWAVQMGMPTAKITEFERLGLTLREAIGETRAASKAYAAALWEGQEKLGTLDVPLGFERYHEATERSVNQERLLAELMLSAVEGEAVDEQTLQTALRFWRKFGRASAVERAQRDRAREYGRAVKDSGYLAARLESRRATEDNGPRPGDSD